VRQQRTSKMNTTRLESSWGTVVIDSHGRIVEMELERANFDNEPCYIDDIERFDLAEYNDWFFRRYGIQPDLSELDILELGYYKKDGTYKEPDKWRYVCRVDCEKMGTLKVINNI